MIRLASTLLLFLLLCQPLFAQAGKTVVTGDEMEVGKDGNLTISKGDSKAVSGANIVKADKMSYDKIDAVVKASGNVKLTSKTDKGEPLKAFGDFAEYDLKASKGKLWGKNTTLEYYMSSSTSPLVLNAGKVYFDRTLEILSAYDNVKIITSSGTIYSDNAVFDKKTGSIDAVKDKKRPKADVHYDGRSGVYEADKMTFYNSGANKKIIMKGNVSGTIQMQDKIGK